MNWRFTGVSKGEPGGIRTLDPRIKSPLLCQLSYRPSQVQRLSSRCRWTRIANELLTSASSASGSPSFAGPQNLVQSPGESFLHIGDDGRINVQRRDGARVTEALGN